MMIDLFDADQCFSELAGSSLLSVEQQGAVLQKYQACAHKALALATKASADRDYTTAKQLCSIAMYAAERAAMLSPTVLVTVRKPPSRRHSPVSAITQSNQLLVSKDLNEQVMYFSRLFTSLRLPRPPTKSFRSPVNITSSFIMIGPDSYPVACGCDEQPADGDGDGDGDGEGEAQPRDATVTSTDSHSPSPLLKALQRVCLENTAMRAQHQSILSELSSFRVQVAKELIPALELNSVLQKRVMQLEGLLRRVLLDAASARDR